MENLHECLFFLSPKIQAITLRLRRTNCMRTNIQIFPYYDHFHSQLPKSNLQESNIVFQTFQPQNTDNKDPCLVLNRYKNFSNKNLVPTLWKIICLYSSHLSSMSLLHVLCVWWYETVPRFPLRDSWKCVTASSYLQDLQFRSWKIWWGEKWGNGLLSSSIELQH